LRAAGTRTSVPSACRPTALLLLAPAPPIPPPPGEEEGSGNAWCGAAALARPFSILPPPLLPGWVGYTQHSIVSVIN